MRYSTRTRYGLRFLINLAGHPPDVCVQLAEIAREEGLSIKYLEQIVRVLRPTGLLRSSRGARGGYALAKAPEEISMYTVFESLEGHTAPVDCLYGAPCAREGLCSSQWFWKALDGHTRDFLESVTLARFIGRENCPATHEGGAS